MIRLSSFSSDNLIPVLSGVLTQETTSDTYGFVTTLLRVLPVDESAQESYFIMSSLSQLNSIYSRTDMTPAINKETVMNIIRNNIYEELKENRQAGFKEYARNKCQLELDVFNEEVIGEVASVLLSDIEYVLDEAIASGYSLEESMSHLLGFQSAWTNSLLRESGTVLEMLSNSDMSQVTMHFWGWKKFLMKNRIFSSSKAAILMALLSDTIKAKENWVQDRDVPITSIEQINQLREDYISDLSPILQTPYHSFNQQYKILKENLVLLVASKGQGKTAFASFLSGLALASGLKVMFYSPETPGKKLVNESIIPSYVRAKYGFFVNARQVVGLDEPYPQGSNYSVEEKKAILALVDQEIADDGNFMHVQNYLTYDTLEEDLRAMTKSFEPDIIVFDHHQEVRGNSNRNDITSKVAITLKGIVKDYKVHCLLLAHPNGDISKALPTPESPVSSDKKIVSWSGDQEQLADVIMGGTRVNDMFKIFFTKNRNAPIAPMYQVFRVNPIHSWFDMIPEDQYKPSVTSDSAVDAILAGKAHTLDFGDEDSLDDDFDI